MRAADHLVFVSAIAVVAGLTLTLGVKPALAEPSNIFLRQLTNITTGTIQVAKLQMEDAGEIAFVSTADVMGPGTQTALRQIYVWRETADGGGTIQRITNQAGCESYDVARPTDTVFSDRPRLIAFVSTCDFDPAGDNSDGNPEIFFYDLVNSRFHQVTNTPSTVINADPFTSDSARCLVFRSNGNLDNNDPGNPHYDNNHPGPGFSNPDGSFEVFLYGKLAGGPEFPHNATFTQVSNGPAGTVSSKPVIGGYWFARQCQTTAYQSTFDQSGTGLVGQHIFIYHMPASAIELMAAAEIPNGLPPGTYEDPMISSASPFARGPHVVFVTAAGLWNNGTVGKNMFDYRAFHPRMTQFTNVGTTGTVENPEVADGGGVLVFDSTGEHLHQGHPLSSGEVPPFNADGNSEIFRLKGRRRVAQITQTANCQNTDPSLSDDGKRLAFVSTCDLIPGENSLKRPQIFMWSRERAHSPLLLPGACTQANGCCMDTKHATTCYHSLEGRKPKIPRPNCVERAKGCD